MTKTVPFVSNTDDDLHCVQASFMIALKYFRPDVSIEWEEWGDITGFQTGMGTWPMAALVWFKQNGFTVKHIEAWDFERFIAEGEGYLRQKFTGETLEYALKNTNVSVEQERSKELVKYPEIVENRNPTIEDVTSYIDQGYLVRASVNAKALSGQPGFSGHSVIVFDYNAEGLTMHDPGLPPVPNRRVTFEDFIKAWKDPETKEAEMDAIKA